MTKPPGLLVHPSELVARDEATLLDQLRVRLGADLWPVHRLDRATSGLLVFARHPAAAAALGRALMAREVRRRYLAVVRGWPEETGTIDHPVKDRDAPRRPARPSVTRFRTLARIELPVAIERYPTARLALVALSPVTGRRHQLRRHLKHLSHPIIGDTSYGRGAYNRYFRAEHGVQRLLLHAGELAFPHPTSGASLAFTAHPEGSFARLLDAFGWAASP